MSPRGGDTPGRIVQGPGRIHVLTGPHADATAAQQVACSGGCRPTMPLGALPVAGDRLWLAHGAAASAQARVVLAAQALFPRDDVVVWLTGDASRVRLPPWVEVVAAEPPDPTAAAARPTAIDDLPPAGEATIRAALDDGDLVRAWVAWHRLDDAETRGRWCWIDQAFDLATADRAAVLARSPHTAADQAMRAWALDRDGHARRARHLLRWARQHAETVAEHTAVVVAREAMAQEPAPTASARAGAEAVRRGQLGLAATHREAQHGPDRTTRHYHDHASLDAVLSAARHLVHDRVDACAKQLAELTEEARDAPSVARHALLARWALASRQADHALVSSIVHRCREVLGDDLPEAPYRFLLDQADRSDPALARRLRQALYDASGPARRATLAPLLVSGDGPLILDDYLLERPIGGGGMGVVWSGRHLALSVPVAVKVVSDAERAREVFRSEVELVSRLEHPHLVGVLDIGEVREGAAAASGGQLHAGSPYLVMERVDGGTLHGRIGALSSAAIVRVVDQVLQALAYAHGRGVVHRDVKPANVLLTRSGDARLADFGLAVLHRQRAGTPRYMAPEQFRQPTPEPRSDLYSVGVMVWELFCRKPPYRGPRATMEAQHAAGQLPPFRPTVDAPDGTEELVRWCLHPDLSRRVPSAWALLQAWRELGDASEASARVAAHTPPTPTPSAPTTFVLDEPHDPTQPPPAATPAPAHRLSSPVKRTAFRPRVPTARLLLRGDAEIVGQREARHALLAALQDAIDHRQPVHLALVGLEGTGRRTLVRWLRNTAREQGFAIHDAPEDGATCVIDDPGSIVPADAEGQAWLFVHARPRGVDGERVVQLHPLAALAQYFAVRQRTPIAPEVAAQAIMRAAGRPAVMLRVVDGWRRRPGLRSTPTGLGLLGSAAPSGVARDWWRDHLRGLSDAARGRLQTLAALPRNSPSRHLAQLLERAGHGRVPPEGYHYVEDQRWTLPVELRLALEEDGDPVEAHRLAATLDRAPHEGRMAPLYHRVCGGEPVPPEEVAAAVREIVLDRGNATPWHLDLDRIDALRLAMDTRPGDGSLAHDWLDLAKEVLGHRRMPGSWWLGIGQRHEAAGHWHRAAAAYSLPRNVLSPDERAAVLAGHRRLLDRVDEGTSRWLRTNLAVASGGATSLADLLAEVVSTDDRMLEVRLRLMLMQRTTDLPTLRRHAEAIVARPHHPAFGSAALANLAHGRLVAGDAAGAERVSLRAVSSLPASPEAWVNLAMAQLLLGHAEEAGWAALEGARRSFQRHRPALGQQSLLVVIAGSLGWPTERWEDFVSTVSPPQGKPGDRPIDPLLVDIVEQHLRSVPSTDRSRRGLAVAAAFRAAMEASR